ncbi:putative glycoside hydrolase [Virgibacillus sp. W0181]|uniref:putative glycoside hydrolase n=1 Tax=Virgibacillus sp. W0181 TaxID=3391581 RepID=UPI003F461645
MIKKQLQTSFILTVILLAFVHPVNIHGDEIQQAKLHQEREINIEAINTDKSFQRFTYDTGLNFEYPEAVRGIYVTGPSAGGERLGKLIDLVETTKLNAMVIDVKEDFGKLTFRPEDNPKYKDAADNFIKDPRKLLEKLEEKEIYPIARIVVFKDSVLSKKRPELSFTKNGKVWVNNKGEAFVNPFSKEVWDYNIGIAKMAAELGFQEIQFDYVRFPEGFERRDKELDYTLGDYKNSDLNNIKKRVQAVTDFVAYAKKELEYYDVDVSVDIFGYAATVEETPGIGQNFSKISSNVDVISSMIYPSHWTSYFDIPFPDKEPYRLVSEYAKVENDVLDKLENRPTSRPWIQDFEAPWLYDGPATQYGKKEVEAQINALKEHGINEYLLWNAGNTYTKNVDYK